MNYNNLPIELVSPSVDYYEAPKEFKEGKDRMSEFKRRFMFVIDISIVASEIDFPNYVILFMFNCRFLHQFIQHYIPYTTLVIPILDL